MGCCPARQSTHPVDGQKDVEAGQGSFGIPEKKSHDAAENPSPDSKSTLYKRMRTLQFSGPDEEKQAEHAHLLVLHAMSSPALQRHARQLGASTNDIDDAAEQKNGKTALIGLIAKLMKDEKQSVTKEDDPMERAQEILYELTHGEDMDEVLRDSGMSGTVGQPCGSGNVLMVVYTDLEPGACMGIAQLWQWKIRHEGMEGQPLIIHHANFDAKDHGEVFDKKQLIARLMLGAIDIHTLTHEGDPGGSGVDDEEAPSRAALYASDRDESLNSICEKLASYRVDRIDWYIMSPGCGNLAAIVDKLGSLGAWPLLANLRVTMCMGSYNLRGMYRADLQAIEKLSSQSDSPLVLLDPEAIFGHERSIADFASPGFQSRFNAKCPLLVAVIRLFQDEFHSDSIHPSSTTLFRSGLPLTEDERRRFQLIKAHFGHGESEQLVAYATAFVKDSALLEKVTPFKQSLLTMFASGGCDASLCDQLPFLHECLRHQRPHLLESTKGSCFDLAAGKTSVQQESNARIQAIRPSVSAAIDNASIAEIGAKLETYLFFHLSAVADENFGAQGGNLCFGVPQDLSVQAKAIIDRHYAGDELDATLPCGALKREASFQNVEAKVLMVVYTDLDPSASMGIALLSELKAKVDGSKCQLLIIQHTNFDSKDVGKVFEMKRLVARLMFGPGEIYALAHEGDQGGARSHCDVVHPKAAQLQAERDSTIRQICDRIAGFSGERIDWYILSPGSGNLASIIRELERTETWPLKPKLNLCLYSGVYNLRGMWQSDLEALEKMSKVASGPMLAVDKPSFFGGNRSHPWTGSLSSFATPEFAKRLAWKAPLLATVLKLCSDEINKQRIQPMCKQLFDGVLHGEERRRFAVIARLFERGEGSEVRDYAEALVNDHDLFSKLENSRKNTFRALAHDGCDFSLSDLIPFIVEWLRSERPDSNWLSISNGSWACNLAKGTMEPRTVGNGSFAAETPVLENPKDEVCLAEIRDVLWTYLEQHLDKLDLSGDVGNSRANSQTWDGPLAKTLSGSKTLSMPQGYDTISALREALAEPQWSPSLLQPTGGQERVSLLP